MVKAENTVKESMKDVHGNLVVSYEEGEVLGNVGDIFFDRKTCGIQGITIIQKFLEPNEKNFIKFKDIQKLGNSVVIVSKRGALGTKPSSLKAVCLRLLRDIRITTQEGETLGQLSDVDVDAESGVVSTVHLYGDKAMAVDVAKDKIRIGPDMIVVPNAYKAEIKRCVRVSKKPNQAEDALSNAVKNAGIATRRFADSIASSFNEAIQKVSSSLDAESSEEANKTNKASSTTKSGAKKATSKAAGGTPTKKSTVKKATKKKVVAKKKVANPPS